jgi:2-polyprenyl-3-methyl-5-hydroxy-6-metoxy-1,4-benzoquinol methylase
MNKKGFNIKDYDERYFKWHKDHTRDYAIRTMDWYIDTYKPKSIIDYGCGIGAYLESGLNNNINKLKGFDIGGDYVKKYTESRVQPFIEYLDCTKPLETEKYDCSISLETGEHIETQYSEQFIKNITKSTEENGVILYSAAQPGQPGTGHINCQPKEFWVKIFNSFNFFVDEDLTKHISSNWSSFGAPYYIVNNLIVLRSN